MRLADLQSPEFVTTSPLLAGIVGLALLCAGRRLFWLFVGAIGFIVALRLAGEYIPPENRRELLIISLAAGLLGAVVAIFVQKIAVAVAGALTGGYLLDHYFTHRLAEYPAFGWVFVLGAAILGAFLMIVIFKWALILLSSLAGAHLIVQAADVSSRFLEAVMIALVVLGVLLQARAGRRSSE